MPIEILMPALSPTMTEGNLAKWLKGEGDAVAAGDVIAEIETDKATMEVEAVDEGVLGRILVPDGSEGIQVNQPIALLLEEGEDTAALEGYETGATPSPAPTKPAAEPVAEAVPPPAAPPQPGAPATDGTRIFASPLARRMAQQAGIDLGSLNGSGPNGRIVKADLEAAISRRRPPRVLRCQPRQGPARARWRKPWACRTSWSPTAMSARRSPGGSASRSRRCRTST
jgi:pyruvate dehydrogenase E2 component (dihydrolipoamide acetyltransferase)